jgi:hypothetical protein
MASPDIQPAMRGASGDSARTIQPAKAAVLAAENKVSVVMIPSSGQ